MMTGRGWISVFCGSSSGTHLEYTTAAWLLGQEIARRGYGLLYGGSDLGLMGEVSFAAYLRGSKVRGVISRLNSQLRFSQKNKTLDSTPCPLR